MKLMNTLKALVALSLLFSGASLVSAQDEEAAPVAAGYEKIDLPPKMALLPKPVAPLPGASRPEIVAHQTAVKEWRTQSNERKKIREDVRKASEAMVRGGAKDKAMENYFARVHFPLMTQSFATIQRERKYVIDELAKADPTTRPELLKLASDWAKKLAEGNYAPATRVNAALLMGELNDADGRTPVPHRAALNYLVSLLDNPAIPAEVKGAALVGITRHVEIDAIAAAEKLPANQRIPQADLDAVVDKMIAIATAKEAPADVDKSVFTFMQRRAAGVLGAYGQVGANNKVFETLVGIVANDAAPRWVRYEAAMALGRLSYTDAKIEGTKAGKALGAYVAYSANDELDTLKKLSESGTGGVGGMGPGMPGGMGGGKGGGPGGPPAGIGGPPGGIGGPPGGIGGPPGGIGGPPGGIGGPPGGIGGGTGGGARGGAPGGFGGFGGGSGGTYYAENLITPMVRRLMATINAAQIGLDGANGRAVPGIRKPKQDTSLDLIAEKIDGIKALLIKLQKNEDDQSDVMRDLRLAILAMESAAGVKKKSATETAKTTSPPAGTTGGE